MYFHYYCTDQNIRIPQPSLAGSCGPWRSPGWCVCPRTAHSPWADCQSSLWAPWRSPAILMHLFQHADEVQPPEICQLPPFHTNPPSAGDHESWTPRSSASHHHSLGIHHLPLQPGQGSACHGKRRMPKNNNADYSSNRVLFKKLKEWKKFKWKKHNKKC